MIKTISLLDLEILLIAKDISFGKRPPTPITIFCLTLITISTRVFFFFSVFFLQILMNQFLVEELEFLN